MRAEGKTYYCLRLVGSVEALMILQPYHLHIPNNHHRLKSSIQLISRTSSITANESKSHSQLVTDYTDSVVHSKHIKMVPRPFVCPVGRLLLCCGSAVQLVCCSPGACGR